jgi:hypothetical protein
MPTASEPFLLVRFLCGLPKKINTAFGPRPDDQMMILNQISNNDTTPMASLLQ